MAVSVIHASECPGDECVPGCRFVNRGAMLEPVPLDVFAQSMRDESWWDMRIIGHGNVPRVRVMFVLVTATNETVGLLQEYPGDSRAFDVDSEDIMWAAPSIFDRADVPHPSEKLESALSTPRDGLPWQAKVALPIIHKWIADAWGGQPPQMFPWQLDNPKSLYQTTVEVRYAAIWLLWELTDLSQLDCCRAVGYQSVQPFLSAKHQLIDWVDRRPEHKALRERIKKIYTKVVAEIGHALPPHTPHRPSVL